MYENINFDINSIFYKEKLFSIAIMPKVKLVHS